MKTKVFQIVWHSREGAKNEPILSLDCHPSYPLLATAGMDCTLRFWRFSDPYASSAASPDAVHAGAASGGAVPSSGVEFLFTVSAHNRSVNVVRWSPSGDAIASAGDEEGMVYVFRPKPGLTWETVTTEKDLSRTLCYGGGALKSEIYDLSWCPDGRHLAVALLNQQAAVLDTETRKWSAPLSGHTGYVQGVAWDPANAFIATQSNDRTVRIFTNPAALMPHASGPASKGAKKEKSESATAAWPTAAVLRTRAAPALAVALGSAQDGTAPSLKRKAVTLTSAAGPASAPSSAASAATALVQQPLFLDENVPSFFRRPCWTPDGSLLITPSGFHKGLTAFSTGEKEDAAAVRMGLGARPTTFAFARDRLASGPICHFPGTKQCKASVAVRTNPCVYRLGLPSGSASTGLATAVSSAAATENPSVALPYRMVVAIATLDSVHLFDTQQALPLATLGGFHLEKITDVAWSASGSMLFVSSYDGYVSGAAFAPGELGAKVTEPSLLPPLIRQRQEMIAKTQASPVPVPIEAAVLAPAAHSDALSASAVAPPLGGVAQPAAALQPRKRAVLLTAATGSAEPTADAEAPAAKRAKLESLPAQEEPVSS